MTNKFIFNEKITCTDFFISNAVVYYYKDVESFNKTYVSGSFQV